MVRVGEAESAVERASVLAAGLSRRFVAVLRHSDIGDRRQADRFPVELSAVIRLGDRSAPTRTVDLSRGGALLCQAEDLPLQSGDQIGLDLESVGPMRAAVVAVSGLGVHCAFREPDELTERRLANRIAEIELEYRPLINATTAGAARIERAMEALVAAGRLTQRDLFDTNYRQIPGTDPIQYETPSTAALEAALTPIQEELLAADRGRIFCIAVDRNGYIPVHNRIYSQPQRPGQTDWNLSYCRNKRIFDDRAGITAARSSRPFVVQAYARQMGGGETVMMREVDVPLKPFGRHWGAFRIAHRF
jgi:methyl-accepting chemotaxis protein